MNRCSLLLAALCFSEWRLSAQDHVVIQHPGGSRIPLTCYVKDYTGREITVLYHQKPSEAEHRYPREDVIEVTTDYTPHHEQGRKLFSAGKIADANLEFAAALKEDDRPWVRREILAGQTKCALWNGDYLKAVSSFLAIVQSDPDTFYYNLIPLSWTDDQPTATVRAMAREWIAPASAPISKLIGASWLLSVVDSANEAEQMLKRLSRESDSNIQRLAQMQVRRTKLKNGALISPDEIDRWQQLTEQLPVELRGGTYFIIGQAWKQRREHDQAARAFLWLPMVYDTDRWLSSRACFEAADSLNSLGDTAQAANLYSEVVFRFGDTPKARAAEAAWKIIQVRREKSAP